MLNVSRRQAKAPTTVREGVGLQQRLKLDDTLPERLAIRPDQRRFDPLQLDGRQGETGTNPFEMVALLKRKQPVGGWEPVIEANRRALLTEIYNTLEQRFGAREDGIPVRTLLQEFGDGISQTNTSIRAQEAMLARQLTDVSERLSRWQEEQGEPGDWMSILAGWMQFVLGSRMSRNQALDYWNERENLAFRRDLYRAAGDVLAEIAESLDQLNRAIEQVAQSATGAILEAQARAERIISHSEQHHRYDYQVNIAAIAGAVARQPTDRRVLEQLFAALREGNQAALQARAKALAEAESERVTAALDIVSLLELEGSELARKQGLAEPIDAAVLVGEDLLDLIQRENPSWRLTKATIGRRETLQIVPNGEAVFDHPALHTASFGEERHRLAFLEMVLDVAAEDVHLLQEWRKPFAEARRTREYYILEAMLVADPPDLPPAPIPPTPQEPDPGMKTSPNGTVNHAVENREPDGVSV